MFKWLSRRKQPPEPPGYAAIARTPTRGVPSVLADGEATSAFAERCEALRAAALAEPVRPSVDTPLLTQLAGPDGLLTIPVPGGAGHCLPLFSSPLRAADYARVHFGSAYALHYRTFAARELADALPALMAGGVVSLAIDRCPRCAEFMAVELTASHRAPDLIVLWAIARASQTARAELWLTYAEDAARAGDPAVARDIALECVAHVAPDDRRAHVLLRDVAVATGDLTLLSEAKACLQFLGAR